MTSKPCEGVTINVFYAELDALKYLKVNLKVNKKSSFSKTWNLEREHRFERKKNPEILSRSKNKKSFKQQKK